MQSSDTTTSVAPTVSAPPASPIRASDADRECISRVLHDAAASGMLTLEEVDERLAELYTSRFTYMLDALVADLPVPDSRRAHALVSDSIADHARQVFASLVGLGTAILMLANRHRTLSIAIAVVTVVLMAVAVRLVGFELEGRRDFRDR